MSQTETDLIHAAHALQSRHLSVGQYNRLRRYRLAFVREGAHGTQQSKTTSIRPTDSNHVLSIFFGSALFIVIVLRLCSVSGLLCSLIDWPPLLLGLSN